MRPSDDSMSLFSSSYQIEFHSFNNRLLKTSAITISAVYQNVTTADRDVSIHWLTLLPDTYTVPGLCIWQSNYMYFNQSSVIWEFSIFWQLLCVTTVVVLTTACRVCTGGRHLFPNEKKGICWVWNWASAGENSSRNID